MSLLHNELARWKNGQLELRPEPLRVRWLFDDLVASDGHVVRCSFTCSVQGLADPTERRMLREVLLQGHHSVTDDTVAAHFAPSLRAAAERAVEGQPVGALLEEQGRLSICDALRAAGKAVAFACGVELLPPFNVDTESPTLRQQRLRSMQRAAAEEEAAGQVEHFQRAAELLKQFQALRQSAPELSPGQVLQQINAGDRGPVLQTLLLGSAQSGAKDSTLWAVAGTHLVRVGPSSQPELSPLSEAAGPLRSVQAADVGGERVLLVGARSGFLLVRPGRPSQAEIYRDPQLDSPLGFNRVVYWAAQDRFVACHGDGGIVQWAREEPEQPVEVLRAAELMPTGTLPPPRPRAQTLGNGSIVASVAGAGGASSRPAGPRYLQVVDGSRLIFAVGPELRGLSSEGPFEVPGENDSDVVAILPDDRRLTVVHEDGMVCVRDRATLSVICRERRVGRVRAAAGLPWQGELRVLLAGDDGPVQCVGFDDPLVTQYATLHRGLRQLAGSPSLVAAVSPDRQRLILWNSWDGRRPVSELAVAALTRHRIADVAFG